MTADLTGPVRPLVLLGRVWNGLSPAPLEAGAVLIEGERLAYVGPAADLSVPEGAEVVRTDGTILPGLIDLHVHSRESYLGWFTASGVTSVRDGCNPWEIADPLRTSAFLKPRLHLSGPLLDGPECFFQHFFEGAVHHAGDAFAETAGAWAVNTPREVEAAVERLAARDITHLKLYEQLAPDVYVAACRAAHRLGLPVMTDLGTVFTRGLTGSQVDARLALSEGVRSIEHASGYALAYQRMGGDPRADALDGALLDELADRTVQAGTALVPTLMVTAPLVHAGEWDLSGVPLGDLEDGVMSGLMRQWRGLFGQQEKFLANAQADRRFALELTRRVHERGGLIGAGSDTPAGAFNLPGGALHEELEQLTLAGLSPLAALKAATGDAARVLGRTDLGVLRAGNLADVLVVSGDPLRDVRATRQIERVVVGGQAFTAAQLRERALDQGTEAQRREAERFGNRT